MYEITQRHIHDDGHDGVELNLKINGLIYHTLEEWDTTELSEDEAKRLMINDVQDYLNEFKFMLEELSK